MKPIKMKPASGGWLWVDWGAGKAWVRFDKDKHDRLTHIAELHMLDPTPERLRRVPLARIQAAVARLREGAPPARG